MMMRSKWIELNPLEAPSLDADIDKSRFSMRNFPVTTCIGGDHRHIGRS